MSGGGNERLRVAHVLGGHGGIGGAERVLAALVSGSGPVDHCVIAPFVNEQHSAELRRVLRDAPVVTGGASRVTELPTARRWLEAMLSEARADVVHAHLFHASTLVASLSSRVPHVLTHHHGSLFHDQGRRAHEMVDRWAGRRYDRIVAVSHAVASFLTEVYEYPSSRIQVIHNGWTGTPRTRDVPEVDFVSISHLRREKGHEVLLDAFAQVGQRAPSVRLRIAGDGPLRSHLEQRCRHLGIEGSVEFLGAVPDVWDILARAGLAVFPSLTEPQGIAVLEAMAAGCPVIASRVGGIPEMVDHGRNGHLVPPADAPALADAMLRLHGDDQLRARYRDEGLRTAGQWRMDTTVHRYEALYRELAQQSGAPRGSS